MEEIKEKTEIVNLELTKTEYDYLKEFTKELFKGFQKLPAKLRSEKYYLLENLVNSRFKE